MLKRRKREAGDGPIFPKTNAAGLLNYVHKLDGGSFKTKDMRTLHGTRIARDAVAEMPEPKNAKEHRTQVLTVAKRVAAALGNTPSVALTSYISPTVFAPWNGSVFPNDNHKEESSMPPKNKPLFGVRFGAKQPPDWRKVKTSHDPDDDAPCKPYQSVVKMLGFDP